MNDNKDPEVLKAKLNSETAQIPWEQLQRFFAAGKTRLVAKQIDLVNVALQFAEDNAAQIDEWTQAGDVVAVDDATATRWIDNEEVVWAVVVAPWVLVQTVDSAQ